MKKVIIEITDKGWTTRLHIEGREYEEKSVSTYFGAERIKGNFNDEEELIGDMYEPLIDALGDFSSYDIMRALSEIE